MSDVTEALYVTPVLSWRRHLRQALHGALRRAWACWRMPAQMTAREWADAYLYLSPDAGSARPGKYRSDVTPWLTAIQDVIDDPAVYEIVCMKSSQIGWTVGVVMSYIGKRIDVDPCPIVVMFPTADAAREFNQEKFGSLVDVTPRLRAKVDMRSRQAGNRATFKKFPGGFLKFVGSNSPRSVKSSSAPVLIVEEPDDASQNVKGQGDSITLLIDRAKTFSRYKVIIGGTPTLAGLSAIEARFKKSDQRKLFVPCHHCGADHVLSWDNVRWDDSADIAHEVYGKAQPETAAYYCPHCGGQWNDYDKNENVTRAARENGWRPTAPFNGIAGFGGLSELYVPWPHSAFAWLVRRFLEAKHEADQGDDSKFIAFYNSTLGLPYEYGGRALDHEAVRENCTRDQAYAEGTVPAGGLRLTAGVDVQHNRFAFVVRAWSRDEESFLVRFGEIYGRVNDRTDPVWRELEQLLFGAWPHASGRELFVAAVTIDSSDGATSDAVYDWVRAMLRIHHCLIMPGKGASDQADKEIFSLPKPPMDHRTPTKAMRYGLRTYIVGTNRAKDLLLGGEHRHGRLHLTGAGPGRFHVYPDVRADYWEHLTSEVKAPSRRLRGRTVYQLKSGRHNEGLDCEIYALHAARALKLHVYTPAQWEALARQLAQADLFNPDTAAAEAAAPAVSGETEPAPALIRTSVPPPPRRKGGFVNRWRN